MTSSIFSKLATAGVEVLDIEQIVLRRRLVLGVLVTAPRDWKRLRTVIEETAEGLGMHVDVDRGVGDNKGRRDGRSHVTIIGSPLKASAMAAIAGRIADSGANIDRIERMARYPSPPSTCTCQAPTPRSSARCWRPRRPPWASTSPSSRPT